MIGCSKPAQFRLRQIFSDTALEIRAQYQAAMACLESVCLAVNRKPGRRNTGAPLNPFPSS
jgi:hypothetical protein